MTNLEDAAIYLSNVLNLAEILEYQICNTRTNADRQEAFGAIWTLAHSISLIAKEGFDDINLALDNETAPNASTVESNA